MAAAYSDGWFAKTAMMVFRLKGSKGIWQQRS